MSTKSSTRGEDRLCPPNNTVTPGFSDLPTALGSTYHVALKMIGCVQKAVKISNWKEAKFSILLGRATLLTPKLAEE